MKMYKTVSSDYNELRTKYQKEVEANTMLEGTVRTLQLE